MSINVNKYNKRSDYMTDNNRPTDECCVSQVDSNVVYNGVNVMLKEDQLRHELVCVVVKDALDGVLYYIPIETYRPAKLDTERYTVQTYIFYGIEAGKKMMMHKHNVGDLMWGQFNRYKIEVDTTAAGGFSWSVTINGTAKSGTVEWAANDTIDSIVAQMQSGAVATYLVFSHVEGEDFIRVRKGGYSDSAFTITNATGATRVDLSIYTKVNGVQQAETHRDWQAKSVSAMFPGLGYLSASSTLYAKNGYNLAYRTGGNLRRYKAYWRTNGSATWVAESSVDRMSAAAFAQCADGTIGGADGIALYEKYNGSWDEYMAAGMINLNDIRRNGMEFRSYDNGSEQNAILASITTMDFDGNYIQAYPAASKAAETLIDGQPGALPTVHEIGVFMEDEKFAKINQALAAIGGTALSITGYYWGVAEYAAGTSWNYNGYTGCIDGYVKSHALSVRPVHASL